MMGPQGEAHCGASLLEGVPGLDISILQGQICTIRSSYEPSAEGEGRWLLEEGTKGEGAG